jgi:hypothetical protein
MTYEVTGLVIEVSEHSLLLNVGKSTWDIAISGTSSIGGGPFTVGAKVAIRYYTLALESYPPGPIPDDPPAQKASRTYPVTGTLLFSSGACMVIRKGENDWEFERAVAFEALEPLRINAPITVRYRLVALSGKVLP